MNIHSGKENVFRVGKSGIIKQSADDRECRIEHNRQCAPAAGLIFWDAEVPLSFSPMRQRTAVQRELAAKAKAARTDAAAAEALLGCGMDEFLREDAERNYGSFIRR